MALVNSNEQMWDDPDLPIVIADFYLTRHKVAIFVNGCFWHVHSCRRGQSMPATRRKFWEAKKRANVARDRRAKAALRRLGYRVVVLWECRLCDKEKVIAHVRRAVKRPIA